MLADTLLHLVRGVPGGCELLLQVRVGACRDSCWKRGSEKGWEKGWGRGWVRLLITSEANFAPLSVSSLSPLPSQPTPISPKSSHLFHTQASTRAVSDLRASMQDGVPR